MKSIEKPVAKPSYEELEKMLLEALERIKQLEAIIAGMQKKSDLNSQNSSKPPSTDPPWKPRSERKKSKRSTGGQKGHSGQTLKWQNKPDQVLIHSPIGTCTCGRCIGQASISRVIKRQMLDLPELRILVTEHHFEIEPPKGLYFSKNIQQNEECNQIKNNWQAFKVYEQP